MTETPSSAELATESLLSADSVHRRCNDPALLAAVLAIVVGALWLGFAVQPNTPTDDSAEAGFARDMMTHHAQAVRMAETIRTRTEDPVIRSMAVDIELTQQAQIGQLRGWLDQWGLLPTGSLLHMAWMGHPHDGLMPGMATEAQLNRLDKAPPARADVAFLRLMIRHHQSAIEMAQSVLVLTDRPEARRFAEATISAQEAEITAMQSLLGQRGASPGAGTTRTPGPMVHAHGDDGFFGGIGDTLRSAEWYAPLVAAGFAAAWLLFDGISRSRWRVSRRPHRPADVVSGPWLFVGLATLLLSALIHAALAPEHFSEHPIHGWFFFASTVANTGVAAGMLAFRSRGWILAALGGLACLIALYAVFRVVAPPQADRPESFDAVGIATQIIQAVGVLACALLLRTNDDGPTANPAPGVRRLFGRAGSDPAVLRVASLGDAVGRHRGVRAFS